MSDTTRRISDLLPEVLQTDVLKKFFAATADNLFQPEKIEYLNGFIGKKPGWYDSTKDIYVNEISANRRNYQVDATAISREYQSNNITHTLFYEDLLNNIRFQGGLINDHNRLFEQEYYSFGSPFDIDKWINPSSYAWVSRGPDVITLTSSTSINDIQQMSAFTYTGNYFFASDPSTIVDGKTAPLKLSNGLKIKFSDDIDVAIRDNEYIIEGVGRKIFLVQEEYKSNLAWENPSEWDKDVWDQNSLYETQIYVLIGRGSKNKNPWSIKNRWFHISVLEQSKTDLEKVTPYIGKRPIIEFDKDIKLYDFATSFRGYITAIDSETKNLSSIIGQSKYVVHGPDLNGTLITDDTRSVTLDDNMIILFTNLNDPLENNKLYKVTNLRDGGTIVLEPLANGGDALGNPLKGDGVIVLQGPWYNKNIDLPNNYINWYYNGTQWKQGQIWNPYNLTQPPLFDLYDVDGNYLGDQNIYPLSNFYGSTLFEYQIQPTGTVDQYLGFVPVYDSNQPNEFLFENTIVSDKWVYQPNTIQEDIVGSFFWLTSNPTTGKDFYANNWFRSPVLSRQYVVNEFVASDNQTQFVTDQSPSMDTNGPIAITVQLQNSQLLPYQDFTVSGNVVTLNKTPAKNENVKIRTWNKLSNKVVNGYFEIPRNLEANPDTLDITTTSRSQLLSHLESIMINQTGIMGSIIGINNYRDTAQNQSLGTVIVQHRATMLKLMVLNAVNQSSVITSSIAQLSPMNIMQWAQREYLRFYNKFINSIFNLYNNRAYTAETSPEEWVSAALKIINVGKTSGSPWANSGFDGAIGGYCSIESTSPTWVPASATRLGITSAYTPTVFFDQSQPNSPLSLVCHNGAVVVLKDFDNNNLGTIEGGLTSTTNPLSLTNPVARAWLQFEKNMFDNLPSMYSSKETIPLVDYRTTFSAKWRTTNFSANDRLSMLKAPFERWSTTNQIDVFKNTTYSPTDPFTWNYGSCVDKDNQPLPGNWRGIYMHFYDTTSPHLSPWEMVGFTQKPDWWDSEYGAAPYTSGNTKMWSDLRDGRIPQGSRKGTWSEWARNGLLSCIPVDEFGELLTPVLAGVIQTPPSNVQAKNDWKFGDRSPIENVWLTTVDSDFVMAQITYLAKPAQFIEYLWDTTRTKQIFADQSNAQWIYTDINSRKSNSQVFVHRENPQNVASLSSSLTYYGSCGIQHWISEYLVNENLNITKYFGNIIRGSNANLGYRVGGFTDGSSVKLLVDSFGLSGNDSLLLPQEDVTTILSRSGSVQEIFYTGAIIESMGTQGWRVIGYDTVNPLFTIIPSDTNGPKTTVVMDKVKVTEYQLGKKTTLVVPYGTIFLTRQEIYDFLICLGRYQTSQGWTFDQYSDTAGRVQDWSLSAREFLFWSQGPWAAGTYITLSPLAMLTKFSTSFGMVQYVGGVVNGSYSLLDKGGRAIKTTDVDFLRIDNNITVRPLGSQGIYGLRLFVTSLEHAIIFNNKTIFGDTVFDPLLDLRQSRFKILAFRSLDWNGRIEAPGYIVAQTQTTIGDIVQVNNKIISNFEKSANDIRTMYNIDIPTAYTSPTNGNLVTSSQTQTNTTKISALSKHLIAYQSRDYLTNLLVDDVTQFQFYQGMIQQKGTATSIDKLLRNTNILSTTETFEYYEEFAFRSGMYGANDVVHGIDVVIQQDQYVSNPQLIELLGSSDYDSLLDDVITIIPNDNRIINKSDLTPPWSTRDNYGPMAGDLPTAGYVVFGEVSYSVVDDTQLLALWDSQNILGTELKANDRVWKFIDQTRGWDVYRITAPSWKIVSSTPNTSRAVTTITTTDAHGLTYGMFVILENIATLSNGMLSGTYSVFNISTYTFDIALLTQSSGTGGTALVYQSVRFVSYNSLLSNTPTGGWAQGELAYVDGDTNTPWKVYRHQSSYWIPTRTEELKIDTSKILGSRLYNRTSLENIGHLVVWDPIKGGIPGSVTEELNYITGYDPAKYNTGNSTQYEIDSDQAWGPNQLGMTWWDLSTTRYIDYETGSNSYRRQWWGQIAPGTTVDIYEWIRSLVPPSSWASTVASGNSAATGGTIIPTGSVKSVDYPYVQRQERTDAGNYTTAYYFWIKNSITVPAVSFRKLSTLVMNEMLTQPQNSNIAWWSPINTTTALLGNIGSRLDHNQTIWQTNYITAESVGNVYKQWTLLRPKDPHSYPTDALWNRMKASLTEFDDVGNTVPNLYLPENAKTGIQTRPSQSWFKNPSNARRAFVASVNKILKNTSIAPAIDPERIQWLEYFTNSEPLPAQKNLKAAVRLATTASLNAIYYNGNQGIAASLFSYDPEILLIDGITPSIGDRVLIKDQDSSGMLTQSNPASTNGIYEVVTVGSATTQWQLIRTSDFSNENDNLTFAQINVTNGDTNTLTTWYQTNENIYKIGYDSIVWKNGKSPLTWDYMVDTLAERDLLSDKIVPHSKVLVKATSSTNNRWTIWEWQSLASDGKTTIDGWTLLRMQAWNTNNCWNYVDWYAAGYTSSTLISYTFDTISQRNAFLDFVNGDIIKVNNIGSGIWNLYVYDSTTTNTFTTIGVQNGGIELSENLWDYSTYGFGYDGGNYGVDYQGFEYDTRLELEKIIKGLRPNSNQQVGLLKSDTTLNEWNTVFFDMVYHVFAEQKFVDWVFKTSFITLRGFAQELLATPYYLVDKINSLTSYINETKPYRAKIRQFVDFRKVTESWHNNSTDFDKPPYVAKNNQIRILDINNSTDNNILKTDSQYSPWFNYYRTLQEQKTLTSDGSTIIRMSKKVSGNIVIVNIDDTLTTDFLLPPNLPYDIVLGTSPVVGATISVTVYVPSSVVRRINTQLVFDRTSCSSGSGGAADRISALYKPTDDMIPIDSPLLISGCAPKGTVLDGVGFSSVGKWGEPIWDNPEGWDQTTQSFEQYFDVGINGTSPKYWIFQGNGNKTAFELPWPPQQPSSLRILVNSQIATTPNDWIIPNFVTQLIVANNGIGYRVNDIITIQTGTASAFATAEITNVSNIGEITNIKLLTQGYYTYVPDQITIPVTGGHGVNATLAVRWGGTSLQFTTAPSLPVTGPNIWIAEKGSTFEPALGTIFDIAYDGSSLNRPHMEGNHPEELMSLWNRDSLIIDTHVQPSGGFGNVLTQTFQSDGIIDQFIIGQPISASNELIVSVNGILKKQGVYNDYVVNIPYNRVVFVNPPPAGTVTIVSVGFGGASEGLADWGIANPGTDYYIGDIITLSGGTSSTSVAKVNVTAIKAISVDLQNGGSGYAVNDLLFLKDGIGSATLTVKVTSVTSLGLTTGIIQNIEIVNAGYYTGPSVLPSQYYTNGSGTGAQIFIHWGVTEINVIDRGAYITLPNGLGQLSVTSATGGPSSGNGFSLLAGETYIQEVVSFIGDGSTYIIPLKTELLLVDSVLVTYNGEPTTAWSRLTSDISSIALNFIPNANDSVLITVYKAKLFSLQKRQDFYVTLPTLAYTIYYPPAYSTNQTINSMVYVNGVKLRSTSDYGISGSTLIFVGGTIATGDKVTVITWPDDSTASFKSDQFVGSATGLYQFSQLPADFTGVQVWANGEELNTIFDFEIKKIGANYYVSIGETYGSGDKIEVFYPTLRSAKPALAWRSFQNIYGDTQYLRLADSEQTTLSADLNWDDQEIYIQDGRNLVMPVGKQPGIVWIANERIEYYELFPSSTPTYPNQVVLRKFNRGSLGTASGVPDKFINQYWNGTGETNLFLINVVTADNSNITVSVGGKNVIRDGFIGNSSSLYQFSLTPLDVYSVQVFANGKEIKEGSDYEIIQSGNNYYIHTFTLYGVNDVIEIYYPVIKDMLLIKNVDYKIVTNPFGVAAGLYLQFASHAIPQAGSSNVKLTVFVSDWTSTKVCFPSGTNVRDGSPRQVIAGGYVWPYGDQGIQYSELYQTRFLFDGPTN